jgi:ATP-dependent 26S proteasome regulatory subunit
MTNPETESAPNSMAAVLGDPSIPLPDRIQILRHIVALDTEEHRAALEEIFAAIAACHADEIKARLLQRLAETIEQMQQGPLRLATFVDMIEGVGGVPRARVSLQDGTTAFSIVPDESLAAALRCGDTVILDGQGRAVLHLQMPELDLGKEAKLESRVDGRRVQVTLRDFEREVFLVSHALAQKLDTGEVTPGATLIVSEPQRMAFDVLPNADGFSHFRYLIKDPPPDVLVERDIGAPPPYLDRMTEHVRVEMTEPHVSRRYRMRRSAMTMLAGVSGSGKTLSIMAFWRRMYDLMSEVTGVPIDQLPPRVLRIRTSQALSKWLGQSDKQIDRFFDEAEQLTAEPWIAPDGRSWELPLLCIFEECDGLARTRGEDSIHDRIQTTLLQRLDTTSEKLKDRLLVFLFSTNVPHLIDPAFLRRAGGTVERFGRLGRRGLLAVLDKQLSGRPIQSDNGHAPETLRRRLVGEVAGWLFSPEAQQTGMVELTFAGSAHPVVKHRRDFLTGALVDRAVQEACAEAIRAERSGCDQPGLSGAGLMRAFDRQIRAIVEQLQPGNAADHVDVPDATRVASVRRLAQPDVLPFDLHRAS